MSRAQVGLLLMAASLMTAADFSGDSAFAFTKRAVDFGPRPSGSASIKLLQTYLLDQLKQCKCQLVEDNFTARTPRGEIAMKNIIAKFPGRGTGKAIAITGHYDTKYFPTRKFVGASDGASSTGLLLELTRALAGEARTDDVYVVFFDGEEASGDWSDTDKLYGSRHLAVKWRDDGTLAKMKGVINVDMIGDKNLNIKREVNSTPALVSLIWATAADLGYSKYFVNETINIDDDHMPFLQLGGQAVDLIDFDYEPWHEDSDTLDKLSAQSLQIVGRVVHESVRRLEKR
ncbi:MAG: M28 family peptidase [Bryobacteraceae bacterium]